MGYVAKGNEALATDEVRAKVAAIAAKMEKIRELRAEIQDMCDDDSDLWHLDLTYDFDIDCSPIDMHERWLASSHNC